MTMPFGEKAAVIGGRKATQQITVLAGGAPAASPSPGGDYLTRLLADALYAPVNHAHPWSAITATPTTLAGYGITDAQPASAELTAIAGLSSPGYVRRTGPGTYVTVASIPQADVAGGPFLPLAAGAANALTGELYASQGVRVGAHGILRDMGGWGCLFGGAVEPSSTNWLLSWRPDGSEAYFGASTVAGFAIADQDRIVADAAGVLLYGSIRTPLATGFVRSTSGTLSASALVAGDLPGTIASDTTGSAAKWAAARTLTIGSTGKAVDGSTNVSWSLAEIGAAPAFGSGAAGLVWATPAATAGAPSLRALAASDIPSLDASKITTGTFADARIASATTWNAKLSTVTADSTSRAANTFYAAPNGSAGAATFRTIMAADIPLLDASKISTGVLTVSTTGSAATLTTSRGISMTGDGTWSVSFNGGSNVSGALTLASVITAGSAGSASQVPVVTWDAKGRLTAVSSATITPAAIGAAPAHAVAANVVLKSNGSGGMVASELSAYPGNYVQASLPLYLPDLSIWGTARSGDGGRWMHYMGGGAGGIPTGTTNALIQRYQYAGFSGFVVGNKEFYGNTISHDETPAQYSIVAGKAGGSISFHVGDPVLVGSNYRAPNVGSWTNSGLSVYGSLSTSTSLAWGGGILRDHYADVNYFALYGAWVGSYGNNYSLAGSKNGQISWLGGTVSSGLAVNGAGIATATSAGLAVTGTLSASSTLAWGGAGAIPSSDYVVQGNGAGSLGHRTTKITATATPSQSGFYDAESPPDGPQGATWTHMIRNMHTGGATTNQWMFDIAASFGPGVGQPEGYYVRTISAGSTPGWRQLWHTGNLTSSTLPGGPYLPKAGTTGDIGIPISNAYVASASNLAFFGRTSYWTGNPVTSIGLTLDGSTAWLRSPTVRIMGSSYVVADFTDSAIQFGANTSIAGSMSSTSISTGEATIGSMKQVASRFWSTSSVLPVMAANTWCFLVCDFTGGSNVMWTTNSTQKVTIRSGGTTYTTPVNTTLTDGGTNFYANYRTMILIGPTVSTSSQCSVIVW